MDDGFVLKWWLSKVPLLLLVSGLLGCAGGAVSQQGITLRDPDVLGHHEDLGVEGMRLNADVLEISLGRVCYDSVEQPVYILGSPVYDGYGQVMTSTEQVSSICTQSWPAGYSRLVTTNGEYVGHANGGGRVDINVSAAPSSFWTAIEPSHLEVPGVWYTLDVTLTDVVRQTALTRVEQGQPELELSMAFTDQSGNGDGRLDPGESSALTYNVVNIGEAAADGVLLTVGFGETPGVVVDAPIDLGAVEPGEALIGEVIVQTDLRLAATTLIFEGGLESASGHTAFDRVVVSVAIDSTPDRAYVWYDSDSDHADLIRAGAVRVETVLTETADHVFVSDRETQERIQQVVDLGGGSAEERLRLAVDAAGGEAVERVFQLGINDMPGAEVQLIFAVHQTGTADRVYQTDNTIEIVSSSDVVDGFESLARTYVAWLEGR